MSEPIQPGAWYLSVPCKCGSWILFDHSPGPTEPVTLPEKLQLDCPGCGAAGVFRCNEVRHARTRADGRAAPATMS